MDSKSLNNKRNYIRRKKYLNDCITHIKATIDFINLAKGEKIDQVESQRQAISHAQQIEAVCWSPHSRLSADGYQKLMQAKTQEFTRTIIKKNLPSVDLQQLQKLTAALLLERSHTPPAPSPQPLLPNSSNNANNSGTTSPTSISSSDSSPLGSLTAISILNSICNSANNLNHNNNNNNPHNNDNNDFLNDGNNSSIPNDRDSRSANSSANSSPNPSHPNSTKNHVVLQSNSAVPMPILNKEDFIVSFLTSCNNNNNKNNSNNTTNNSSHSANNSSGNSSNSSHGKGRNKESKEVNRPMSSFNGLATPADREREREKERERFKFVASFERDAEMYINNPGGAEDIAYEDCDAFIQCAMMRIENNCECSDFPFAAF